MGSYVIVCCDDRRACSTAEDDGPDGKTLALARRDAKREGWVLTGRDGAVCPACAALARPDAAGTEGVS